VGRKTPKKQYCEKGKFYFFDICEKGKFNNGFDDHLKNISISHSLEKDIAMRVTF
jgi:hypothetical protein